MDTQSAARGKTTEGNTFPQLSGGCYGVVNGSLPVFAERFIEQGFSPIRFSPMSREERLKTLDFEQMSIAEMAEANLYASRLDGAVLDGTSMQLVSAVDADLSTVASMVGVDLTGANLTGARVAPDRMARAWITGAEGLDPDVTRELVRNGAVVTPPAVLDLVDEMIAALSRRTTS